MAALENEHIYGIQIRESANDGSDFPNPDADYRLAFLGEDGLWHVKDSAGAVSNPYSGGGISAGTAFPGSPTADDLFYRTDLDVLCFYDGTRWLSVQKYDIPLPVTTGLQPFSGNIASNRAALPSGTARWIETIYAAFYVTGGTALSASHKWVATFSSQPGATAIGTLSIDSGASDAYRFISAAVGAVNPSTDYWIDAALVKTGTPGTLIFMPRVVYRLIYT